MKNYTLFFKDKTENEHDLLGGKGASLANMTKAGFPVPNGFCVTTDSYKAVFDAYQEKIGQLYQLIDYDDINQIHLVAKQIRTFIATTEMPDEVKQSIRKSYRQLCDEIGMENVPVAVRSSATAEDLPDASFAGQQDTFLWVVGENAVIYHVKQCWASLYTDRAIVYRHDHNIPSEDVFMSVVIQKMVNAKVAGVAMTINPLDGDLSKIVIDAAWGLGESVVSGEVTPDNYVMDKVIYEPVSRHIYTQPFALVPDVANKCVIRKELNEEHAKKATLSRDELITLCKLTKKVEKHYKCPQDIEWALDGDLPDGENLTLLQSRPETVWSQKPKEKKKATSNPYQFGMQGLVNSLLNPINKNG